MDNDLFSTTEALNNAYKEVLKKTIGSETDGEYAKCSHD